MVNYRRGGKITILDVEALDEIAEGEENTFFEIEECLISY